MESVPLCFAITAGADGETHARIVQAGKPLEDWRVRFMTDARCRKAAEVRAGGRLTLAYQRDADRAYVTLIGRAAVNDDVALKRALWTSETWRWHPGGPEDPNNVLVAMTPDRIEMYSGADDIAPAPRGFNAAVLVRAGAEWRPAVSSDFG